MYPVFRPLVGRERAEATAVTCYLRGRSGTEALYRASACSSRSLALVDTCASVPVELAESQHSLLRPSVSTARSRSSAITLTQIVDHELAVGGNASLAT
jgi:hypothetical protein